MARAAVTETHGCRIECLAFALQNFHAAYPSPSPSSACGFLIDGPYLKRTAGSAYDPISGGTCTPSISRSRSNGQNLGSPTSRSLGSGTTGVGFPKIRIGPPLVGLPGIETGPPVVGFITMGTGSAMVGLP